MRTECPGGDVACDVWLDPILTLCARPSDIIHPCYEVMNEVAAQRSDSIL